MNVKVILCYSLKILNLLQAYTPLVKKQLREKKLICIVLIKRSLLVLKIEIIEMQNIYSLQITILESDENGFWRKGFTPLYEVNRGRSEERRVGKECRCGGWT